MQQQELCRLRTTFANAAVRHAAQTSRLSAFNDLYSSNAYIYGEQGREMQWLDTANRELRNKLHMHRHEALQSEWNAKNARFEATLAMCMGLPGLLLLGLVASASQGSTPVWVACTLGVIVTLVFGVAYTVLNGARAHRHRLVWDQVYWPGVQL